MTMDLRRIVLRYCYPVRYFLRKTMDLRRIPVHCYFQDRY
jgi:hypothetical protein